jgi:hypothetical protein
VTEEGEPFDKLRANGVWGGATDAAMQIVHRSLQTASSLLRGMGFFVRSDEINIGCRAPA